MRTPPEGHDDTLATADPSSGALGAAQPPLSRNARLYRAASCFCSSKIGRNTLRQIVPTTIPMTAIMIGSIRLVSCFTVARTW